MIIKITNFGKISQMKFIPLYTYPIMSQSVESQSINIYDDVHSFIRSIQRKLILSGKISEMLRWDVVRIMFIKLSNEGKEPVNHKKAAILIKYLSSDIPDSEEALKKIKSLYTETGYRQKAS